jgi:hypothetical protein
MTSGTGSKGNLSMATLTAEAFAAAEAAWLATKPCTVPSGHRAGFMGFCSHCETDVLFEDSPEYEALFPEREGCEPGCKGPNPCGETCDI